MPFVPDDVFAEIVRILDQLELRLKTDLQAVQRERESLRSLLNGLKARAGG